MHFLVRKPWDLPQSRHTPIDVYRNRACHRREFLKLLGIGAAGWAVSPFAVGCSRATDEEIEQAGAVDALTDEFAEHYPAEHTVRYEYGRSETGQRFAAEYTNFYEFTAGKNSWRYVGEFQPSPWTVDIGGLCSNPRMLDLDAIYNTFSLEERSYRHRCVETWAMCVPWTGFPLRDLLKLVDPKPSAKFVALETFNRPGEAPNMSTPSFPWPYTEGLTIEEATNELAFLATGIYGEPLPKQHGAPIRLVVPWKYGFKSIKSIVKITLTDKQPPTFWNTEWPEAYDFTANVNPEVPHPSWPQTTEWMLGTFERYPTVIYNGYGESVGGLYRA